MHIHVIHNIQQEYNISYKNTVRKLNMRERDSNQLVPQYSREGTKDYVLCIEKTTTQ